jgi:hypothetical protein
MADNSDLAVETAAAIEEQVITLNGLFRSLGTEPVPYFVTKLKLWRSATGKILESALGSDYRVGFEAIGKPFFDDANRPDYSLPQLQDDWESHLHAITDEIYKNPDIVLTPSSSVASASVLQALQELPYPERITLAWLRQYVPVSFWICLLSAFLGTLALGARLGHTDIGRQILQACGVEVTEGRSPPTSNTNKVSRKTSEDLDRFLRQGNQIRQQLLDSWSNESKAKVMPWQQEVSDYLSKHQPEFAAYFLSEADASGLAYVGPIERSNTVTYMDRRLKRLGEIIMKLR